MVTAVGNLVFFAADDAVSGVELWRSDGTDAGTQRVLDIQAGSGSSNPQSLAANTGTLYFQANDGSHGAELWKSDGTAAGTVLVKDIWPGPGGSGPYFISALSQSILFIAADPTGGFEPWISDGTEAGTQRLADIDPGYSSSYGGWATRVGPLAFFPAFDRANGMELWAVPASPRRAVLELAGTAQGGQVSANILGVGLGITTVAGQSSAQVAIALAAAINADATLIGMDVHAFASGGAVILGGAEQMYVGIYTTDPGLGGTASPPDQVPALGRSGHGLLALLLTAAALATGRRSWRTS